MTQIENTDQLPDGWIETTLWEIGKTITGKTPSKDNPEDWGDLVCFVTPTDIKTDSKYINNTARSLSQYGIARFQRMIIPKNSIIVTCIGSDMGKVVINKNDCLTNQQINSLIVNEQFDTGFLYYKLKNSYWVLRSHAEGGSTMPILNKSNFESLQFALPPLPEQQAIASLLSSFDDKIELLREENKTLEKTAQTIFQEWFGKYSVEDELPEGWRVGKIKEIIKREPVSYKCDKKDLDLKWQTPIIDQWANGLYGYTSRNSDFIASKDNPVIIFTNHTCNYWFIDYPFCAIQNVLPYRGKGGYDEYFLYFMTKGSITFIEYKWHWPDFEAKDFIIPSVEKAQEFSKQAKPILKKISNNNSQIQSLSKTRDELLPRLMKGEIRVEF